MARLYKDTNDLLVTAARALTTCDMRTLERLRRDVDEDLYSTTAESSAALVMLDAMMDNIRALTAKE